MPSPRSGQLEHAIAAGNWSALAFRAGPVEMEFRLSFSRWGTREAGIKAWVVTVGARGEAMSADTLALTYREPEMGGGLGLALAGQGMPYVESGICTRASRVPRCCGHSSR